MYKEIEAELQLLSKEMFTGYIRFGVEHGDITSMSVTTKVEPVAHFINNLKSEIEKFCADEKEFYGAIEYVLSFGKITSCNFSISLHGELLKARLRKTQNKEVKQCKSVRVVART